MPPTTIQLIPPEQTHALRHRVLRPHQPFAEMAYPGDNAPETFHLGALDGGGAVVGIVSFYREPMPGAGQSKADATSDWRLRGMAVEPTLRSGGLGAALVAAGLDAARDAGATRVWCNARTSACGFYDRVGFTRQGDPFNIPGIGEHYIMWTPVDPLSES